MPRREPFRIRLADERRALAVAEALHGVSLDISRDGHAWVVALEKNGDTAFTTRVLDAVRRSLGRDPSASAQITLDGRDYEMRGE